MAADVSAKTASGKMSHAKPAYHLKQEAKNHRAAAMMFSRFPFLGDSRKRYAAKLKDCYYWFKI